MIGRFASLGEYRDLLPRRDLALCLLGGLLALASLGSEYSASLAPATVWLALVSFAINGLPIIKGAAEGLLERRINVDELVSLALVACLIQGEFLTAAGVAFIMKLGAIVEGMVSDSARRSIRDLVAVAPEKARRLSGEDEDEVPMEAVRPGDRLRVRPGDRVPVDGVILSGRGALDESSITGESLPVDKCAGDEVFAGTLNHNGVLVVEARKVGEETMLGRVVRLVEEAEAHKPQATRFIDRFVVWFTPLVLFIAALAWALSGEANRAVAVLIAGCPCALIMAAPTATVAAVGRLSRAGVLVKGGRHLEAAASVDAVFFDKTGTLTEGRPKVEEIIPAEGFGEADVLALAACVEADCGHPLAVAVMDAARERGVAVQRARDVVQETGAGVRGLLDGSRIEVGGAAITGDESALPATLRHTLDSIRERGATPLVVLRDGTPVGILSVRDTPRAEAPAALSALRDEGISRLTMLSGDHERAAQAVAAHVGIEEVHAGLTPEGKLSVLSDTREQGRRVMFVGDGVNDAPALARADVGVAMGGLGAHVALESADIALVRDDISTLPFLIRLSRRALALMKINAGLGIAFNALAMWGGGAGFLSPLQASLAHNIGSVIVVLSAASLAFARDQGVTRSRPLPESAACARSDA